MPKKAVKDGEMHHSAQKFMPGEVHTEIQKDPDNPALRNNYHFRDGCMASLPISPVKKPARS